MASYTLDESTPEFTETTFIAPDASLIGRVRIGAYSSVWFNAVLRGDMEHISIGDETSFQDLSMGHSDPGFPLIIGNRVTVGHMIDRDPFEREFTTAKRKGKVQSVYIIERVIVGWTAKSYRIIISEFYYTIYV